MPAVAEVQFKATGSQTVVTAFNSVGTAAQQATTKIQQFSAGATTKIQQFTSSLKSIKSQGDPFSNLTTNLNGFNKSVDQSSQKATSFGQKLKGFGSQFGSSIATIGTLGGTILNLSRQYQDLSDSQIRVDRSQLKVSKTTEAAGVAQGKLNALTDKGITSGAAYDKALLDVQQALEAQNIAERNLQEAQEDHQRAQENFWIGLVPTVTSAGASIISVLNDIGGTKGLGGLKTALGGLKGAFTGLTGIGGLASGLAGIGSAANGSVAGMNAMTGATTGLGTAMKGLALSSLPVVVALGGVALIAKSAGIVIHEVLSVMKGDMLEAVKSMEKLIDFYTKIGSVIPQGAGFAIFTALKPEVTKLRQELEKVPQAIKPISPALQGVDDVAQGFDRTTDALVGSVMELVRHAEAVPAATQPAAAGIQSIGTSATTAAPPITTLNTQLTTMKFPTADVAKFDTYIKNWGSQTMPKATKAVTTINPALQYMDQWFKAVIASSSGLTRMQQQLAAAVNQATKSMNKGTEAAKKYNTALNANYRVGRSGAAPGLVQGRGMDVGHYVTFSGGKKVGGGPGVAPPITKVHQHGYQSTVHRPTMFIAGEGGRPEDVTVRPRGSVQRGGSGGGGGFYGIVNVYVDGVLRPARYDMGARK